MVSARAPDLGRPGADAAAPAALVALVEGGAGATRGGGGGTVAGAAGATDGTKGRRRRGGRERRRQRGQHLLGDLVEQHDAAVHVAEVGLARQADGGVRLHEDEEVAQRLGAQGADEGEPIAELAAGVLRRQRRRALGGDRQLDRVLAPEIIA
jgi:hypothetical protein